MIDRHRGVTTTIQLSKRIRSALDDIKRTQHKNCWSKIIRFGVDWSIENYSSDMLSLADPRSELEKYTFRLVTETHKEIKKLRLIEQRTIGGQIEYYLTIYLTHHPELKEVRARHWPKEEINRTKLRMRIA